MSSPSILARRATATDIPLLVSMMDEFYAEGGYPLDYKEATDTFIGLLSNEAYGAIWIAEDAGTPAGYIVLTVHFSMEYGGLSGSIDDLFVLSAHRRLGAARLLVATLLVECHARKLVAVQVETGTNNLSAQALYYHCGLSLRRDERRTFTCRLG